MPQTQQVDNTDAAAKKTLAEKAKPKKSAKKIASKQTSAAKRESTVKTIGIGVKTRESSTLKRERNHTTRDYAVATQSKFSGTMDRHKLIGVAREKKTIVEILYDNSYWVYEYQREASEINDLIEFYSDKKVVV